jgi:hypothetical protein
LVVEGCGGSGKTTLLRNLSRQLGVNLPHALVDPHAAHADLPFGPVSPMLLASAFGLSRRWPNLGKVSFPRLVLAHVAMRQEIPPIDAGQARAAMTTALNRHRDKHGVTNLVRGLVQDLMAMLEPVPGLPVPGPNVVHYMADLLVGSFQAATFTNKLTFGEALDWFGHQDMGEAFTHRPLDGLIALSWRAHNPDPNIRGDIDDVLAAAFLADLRHSMARMSRRTWNCVLLVDNVDHPAGSALLTTLVRVRQRREARNLAPDPLTVITASSGEHMARVRPTGADAGVLPESTLALVPPAELRRRTSHLRVALEPLTRAEVATLVTGTLDPLVLVGQRSAARTVFGVTGGHPGAVRLVLDALVAEPDLAGDVEALLSRPNPTGTPGDTVEACILRRLADGVSVSRRGDPVLLRDLVTLSAARNSDEAARLLSHDGLLRSQPHERAELLSATLWPGRSDDAVGVMVPVARYLLLRALARRDDADPAGWSTVFDWLCQEATQRGDIAGELHHSLALGQIQAASDRLMRLLPKENGVGWLALVDAATSTPDLRQPLDDPLTRAQRLAADAFAPTDLPGSPVARLVTGLRAVGDPRLCNAMHQRNLHSLIAGSYEAAARFSPDPEALQNRAQLHRDLAATPA